MSDPHRLAAVRRLLRGRRPAGPTARPAEPPAGPTRAAQLRALLPLLERAVLLQPDAEVVVWGCSAPGNTEGSLALRASIVQIAYWKLRRDLQTVRADPALKDEIQRLLLYHEWYVHDAVACAYAPVQSRQLVESRTRLTGLGTPAALLRDLHHRLGEELAALTGPPGAR
ncbi:hypothetical protein OH807_38970 [Kitasatospora sp. NBC_01560]|uniref:hypothetical protein n=1 Tax=Kitasatospora sp. NBC_01560 TaxID=2975965 RepID=UPI003868FDFF